VIIITVGMMIMEDLLVRMNEVAVVVVIIMRITAANRHPIVTVETKDAAVVTTAMIILGGMTIELIGEIMVEGEVVAAIAADAAVNGEVEVEAAILGPCPEAALGLAHVTCHILKSIRIKIVKPKAIDIMGTMVVIMTARLSSVGMIDAIMMIGIQIDGITEMIVTTTITTLVLPHYHHHHIIFIDENQSHHPLMPEMLCLELSAE
jgi:hypothetical protein